MSLYNMLFGFNNQAPTLLACLRLNPNDIPRFRDCFLQGNTICIHTRTGGGNRDYYENEKTCRSNYPEYFDGKSDMPSGPWNDDLRAHPNYLTDVDDEFDCTYANFFFSFPEDFKADLEAVAAKTENHTPNEKWQLLFKKMDESK